MIFPDLLTQRWCPQVKQFAIYRLLFKFVHHNDLFGQDPKYDQHFKIILLEHFLQTLMVSSNGTSLPGCPVKTSATWNG